MPNARFLRCVGAYIGEDGRVGDRFNEPRAEERSRNAKNDVRVPALAGERIACGRKSGWAMLQPGASLRPVITKRSCTPPSAVPLGSA